MLTSTATVATTRASRYRDQLASHGAGMLRQLHQRDHAGGPPIEAATVADETVVLTLTWGRCTIHATPDALVLVAEAASADDLARIQDGVGRRVTKIGRRDRLDVTWSPTTDELVAEAAPLARVEPQPTAPGPTAIILLVGVVLAIHLGIGAAVLHQHWAWWALVALPVVVALKVIVARHTSTARQSHRLRHRP